MVNSVSWIELAKHVDDLTKRAVASWPDLALGVRISSSGGSVVHNHLLLGAPTIVKPHCYLAGVASVVLESGAAYLQGCFSASTAQCGAVENADQSLKLLEASRSGG